MLALYILLDEHAVALAPKTVAKVLGFTNKLVAENHLTTLMITHNMHDTIAYGNRLIMMARVELWLTFETMRRSLRSYDRTAFRIFDVQAEARFSTTRL